MRRSQQALGDRLQHGMRAITAVEFHQQIGHVVLYRAFGKMQAAPDFLVGITAGDQPQNAGLALGQA